MTTIPFDTYAEIERLRESGMSEEQAKAITQTVRNGVTGGVATKADIARLETGMAELKGDIARSQVTIVLSIAVMLGVSLSIYAFLSGAVGQAPAP